MNFSNKKALTIIVYYTLAALALGAAGYFVYAVIIQGLPTWAKFIYYVWTGLVIGAVVFDVICTTTREGKTVSGWVVYILAVLSALMTMLLHIFNMGKTGINPEFFNTYLATCLISFVVSGYLIATWCVGEKIVKNMQLEEKIEKRRTNIEK